MSAEIEWRGVDSVIAGMWSYQRKVEYAVKQIADFFAPQLETYAKENANWTDRTGLARARLRGWTQEVATGIVELYLSHGMHYGIYLEVKYSGKYAIIWPTIRQYLPEIEAMLKRVFG